MHWLDDKPPARDIWFMVMMYLIGAGGIFGLIWVMTGPAKSDEPPTWLVPTLVMPDGVKVTGAPGRHARRYPNRLACEAQAKAARFMVPPQGASDIIWQCLPYDPNAGRGA